MVSAIVFLALGQFSPAAEAAAPSDDDAEKRRAMKNSEMEGISVLQKLVTKSPSDPSRVSNAELVRKIGQRQQLYQYTDSMYRYNGQIYRRHILVSSSDELVHALDTAIPGDLIELTPNTTFQGNFNFSNNGSTEYPIALVGPRTATVTTGYLSKGYGIHLTASHWRLSGFSVKNSGKGIVIDNADNNVIRGIELSEIGQEAIHIGNNSSNNLIHRNYINKTGLEIPNAGRGIVVGTEPINWVMLDDIKSVELNAAESDKSNANRVVSNLIGPGVPAELIKLHKGSSGGTISNNTFISDENMLASSWIDLKSTGNVVRGNLGASHAAAPVDNPDDSTDAAIEDGGNQIEKTLSHTYDGELALPFMAAGETPAVLTLMVPSRSLPYSLSELMALSPETLFQLTDDTVVLDKSILVGPKATLQITNEDASRIRFRSDDVGHVSLLGFKSFMDIKGTKKQPIKLESWHAGKNEFDLNISDGRSYISQRGGQMDIEYASFSHFGYEEGTVSGVSWKSAAAGGKPYPVTGNVHYSEFTGNMFGAYTFEALYMKWTNNSFHNNIQYGFDPHDFSNGFIFEYNEAHNNGSHGIIFSRGCDDNIIRYNHSYSNAGHGVMIDDGHFDPLAKQARHRRRVPSNRNLIEHNVLTDNLDGIVIEGGSDNIVRANTISGVHRYGVRLKDYVLKSKISDNDMGIFKRAGFILDNGSDNNTIINSIVNLAPVGFILRNSRGNQIEKNNYEKLTRSVASLEGDVSDTKIIDNVFVGRGSEIIKSDSSNSINVDTIRKSNNLTQWLTGAPGLINTLGLGVWFAILIFPIVFFLLRKVFPHRKHAKTKSSETRLHIDEKIPTLTKVQNARSLYPVNRRRSSVDLETAY